ESVTTQDENLTGHLLSPDFFDAERFPEVSFRSTHVLRRGEEDIEVDGELTLKGVTKPVTLRGTIAGPAVALGDTERLGLELETRIDRTEFGLTWNAPLPKGGFAVGDEVRITAHLEVVKEAEVVRVLAISGSLRGGSHNTMLLRAAAALAPEGVEVELYDGLKRIPPYDEDDDRDPAPAEVARLREAVAGADALLVATPEYNHSLP